MDINVLKQQAIEKWKEPNVRYAVMGAALIVGVSVFIVLGEEPPPTTAQSLGAQKEEDYKAASFFSASGIQSLDRTRMTEVYKKMETEVARRESQIGRRAKDMERMKEDLMKSVEDVQLEQAEMRNQLKAQMKALTEVDDRARKLLEEVENSVKEVKKISMAASLNLPGRATAANGSAQASGANSVPGSDPVTNTPMIPDVGIRVIRENGDVDDEPVEEIPHAYDVPAEEEKEPEAQFIPRGSVISGVLITGMDLPTGSEMRKHPFPVIIRVKEEAILPDQYTVDLRECVITASAIGQMSSARAYIRAEHISCMRSDGRAVETAMQAFASGPDGRNGIKGRLVSTNGKAAKQSAYAGFLSGLANIGGQGRFNVSQNQTGVASVLEDSSYFGNLAGTASMRGAGEAMDRLAEYFVEIAEEMRPYIEVHPGIKIDFLVQNGFNIKLGATDGAR